MISVGYAAPEQIAGEPVSASADLYSLGVLLFELLTGLHPFDLDDKSYRTIVQAVLNEDPPRPSQKFANLKKTDRQEAIAKLRSTHSGKLVKELKGDLDAIILKSLRKEPELRYQTVSQLVEDIDRYSNHHPVIARRGSFLYRLLKFSNRNQKVLVASLIFLMLFAGFGGFYIYQITEQRNLVQLEAEKANRIKEFTTTLFDAGNPYYEENIDGTVTAKQLLETGILNIETELIQEPALYAEMNTVIGRALIGLGEYERAKESINKVTGNNPCPLWRKPSSHSRKYGLVCPAQTNPG
jgi:eukaryotic-like serine/threonine-protein kinase